MNSCKYLCLLQMYISPAGMRGAQRGVLPLRLLLLNLAQFVLQLLDISLVSLVSLACLLQGLEGTL